MHPASQATEVVRKVVRKVVSKVVRRLITKVIRTCTSSRTTLLMRQLMTFDHGSSWCCREELATPPPPANEGDVEGEAASDPSLPTTRWRGRRQPRNSVQLAGGGVASWKEDQKKTSVSWGGKRK